MKINYRKTILTKILVTTVFIFCSTLSYSQLYLDGTVHISSGGNVYSTGAVTFGATAEVTTSKTIPYVASDGKIILGSGSSITSTSTKFVKGYVETKSTVETLLGIGSGSIYAPIKVTPSTSAGVHAAYVNSAPLTQYAGGLDLSVVAVADTEYWMIKGTDAIVSLSWRAGSDLSSLNYADLTIVGYKNGKWVSIPSTIDSTSEFGVTSTLSGTGSITSDSNIALSEYEAFAIGEKGVSCPELVVSSGVTKTWDGSWSPSAPTLADPVLISAPYAAGSFVCNSITLNADVTLSGTETLEIVNGASGTGKVIMSSEASLVQRNASSSAPTIELTKTTRSMKRFDYIYWGAPIAPDAFSQLNSAQAAGAALANAFDSKYIYVSGDTSTAGGWQPLTATVPGKGFITRVKEQAPFIDDATSATIDVKFEGSANNGDVQVSVATVSGNPTSARNNNLIANPYPSAIDADKFLTQNNDLLDGVIYLWKASTVNTSGLSNYSNADYIAYTKAGSTAYTGTGSSAGFNGKIASGQGFKVKAVNPGNVLFTNCMRVTGNNSQFYRINEYASAANDNINRFKVKFQSSLRTENQVLVAYLPETTLSYDKMYDAELFSVNSTKIYSILDNNTKKLAINARPEFTSDDQVVIGYTKSDSNLQQMSIDIVDKEGVFANNQTPIFLHDSHLNVYHNFNNGAYTFSTAAQEENNRFKIVYQSGILGNDDFAVNQILASINDKVLTITSNETIEEVKVFDMMGRIVIQQTPANKATTFESDFFQAVGVYVINVKLTNGQLLRTKLINTK